MKSSERVQALANIEALKHVQSSLEGGTPIRSMQLDEAEARVISNTLGAQRVAVGSRSECRRG